MIKDHGADEDHAINDLGWCLVCLQEESNANVT